MITLNSYIVKKKNIPSRTIEGEAILVDIKRGEILHLNSVGTEIWDAITNKIKVSDVVDVLCNSFEVEQSEAHEDTLQLLEKLAERGFVESQ